MGIEAAAIDTSATMMRASLMGPKSTAELAKSVDPKDVKKIESTAKQFEAVFVTEMMKPMFEGIKTDGEFGGGQGEEMFRGMMLDEYGKQVAEKGGFGIADHVKEELLRIQEKKIQ